MKRTVLILLPLLCLSLAAMFRQTPGSYAQVSRANVSSIRGEDGEPTPAEAPADDSAGRRAFVPGELLVKFARGARAESIARRVNMEMGATLLRESAQTGWQHLRLPAGVALNDALAIYASAPGVVAVQPNYIYREAATPDDTFFSSQYGMQRIQAPSAWDTSTGSDSVVVAVLDTGIFYPHEDLAANMWRNPGETGTDANGQDKATNGVDDDADGYVDDLYGIDTYNHDSNPIDDRGHGTHCAGIIGAAGNNGKGVAGVSWNVRLMALKFISQRGEGTTAGAIESFDYVLMMKARGVNVRVTNNSYGDTENDPAFKDALDAAGNAGLLNVCAAGNSATNLEAVPFYPASYDSPGILSVAASDQNDNPAGFTSYGVKSVDLAAPGVSILSTVSDGPMYDYLSGTSMSAPHVAGAAALILAQYPSLSAASLKATILNTADVLPQWAGKTATGGRLNVARALQSPTACLFQLSQGSQSFTSDGGSGYVQLTTPGNCEWTIKSDAPWITLNSANSGSGGGLIAYTVAPNAGPALRTGTLTIADQSFTVTQLATPSADCTVSIWPQSAHFPADGGSGDIALGAAQGCSWKIRYDPTWIKMSDSDGTGNQVVSYAVRANSTTAPRTMLVDIEGQTFTITQDAAPLSCQYGISPTDETFSAEGGASQVSVAASAGCDWTAVSHDAWITITGGENGSGNGVVAYSVAANNGAFRTGTLTIAGLTMTVNQKGGAGGAQSPPALGLESISRAQVFLVQQYGSLFGL